MNRSGGEAFAKLAQQLNRARMQASGGGGKGGAGGNPFGGLPGGGKGAATGGGLIIALAAGGLALNYSLFNGELHLPVGSLEAGGIRLMDSGWWTSSYQIFQSSRCPIGHLRRRYSSHREYFQTRQIWRR